MMRVLGDEWLFGGAGLPSFTSVEVCSSVIEGWFGKWRLAGDFLLLIDWYRHFVD